MAPPRLPAPHGRRLSAKRNTPRGFRDPRTYPSAPLWPGSAVARIFENRRLHRSAVVDPIGTASRMAHERGARFRARRAGRTARRVRRAQPAHHAGVLAQSGRGGRRDRLFGARPECRRPRVFRARRPAVRRPGAAGRGPAPAVARSGGALAEHAAAHARHGHRTAGRARGQRPALQGRGLVRGSSVRPHQAVVPAQRPLAARAGQRRPRARAQGPGEGRLLHPAVHQRGRAEQLHPDQSCGPAQSQGDRRPEPAGWPRAPARRPRAGRRAPADQHGRREGVRGRQERRHLARQGDLPERSDAADPVRAVHRAGVPASVPDRAALDQQVLHPRSAAEEQLHQMVRRSGAHHVRDLLGQPARRPRAQGFRGLHARRAARRARCDRAGDRRARDQHPRDSASAGS